MKASPLLLLTMLLAACAPTPPPEAPVATSAPAQSETLYFQSLTFPGHLWTPFMPPAEEGVPTKVSGILRLPPRTGRVPAVILTHGCGSITSGETAWASKLTEFGIATFMVQSFGAPCVSRGVSIGYNAAAHHQSVQDVQSFLSTVFGLK